MLFIRELPSLVAFCVWSCCCSSCGLDSDWADSCVSASWNLTERLSANSSLGFALGCDDDSVPDLSATMGFSYQIW